MEVLLLRSLGDLAKNSQVLIYDCPCSDLLKSTRSCGGQRKQMSMPRKVASSMHASAE